MAQGAYQGTLPTALFWIVESLLILYPLINYLQKLWKDLQLFYWSVINYLEKHFYQYLSYVDSLSVTLVALFVANFNFSSCKSDNFYTVILSYFILIPKQNTK